MQIDECRLTNADFAAVPRRVAGETPHALNGPFRDSAEELCRINRAASATAQQHRASNGGPWVRASEGSFPLLVCVHTETQTGVRRAAGHLGPLMWRRGSFVGKLAPGTMGEARSFGRYDTDATEGQAGGGIAVRQYCTALLGLPYIAVLSGVSYGGGSCAVLSTVW